MTVLNSLIQQYAQDTGLSICVSTYSDGVELLKDYSGDTDLIFLDIKMKNLDGLQTAQAIRKIDTNVSIIFLTTMSQYALEGYKYNATNFIIKPIKYVRLKGELDRWIRHYRQEDGAFILIANDSGKYKVFLKNLRYIETFGRNLMVHTDSENIVSYRKMKDFETELTGDPFVRCHSSFLVNLLYVKHIEKAEMELTNGERIPISQPRRKSVMEKVAVYWGNRL